MKNHGSLLPLLLFYSVVFADMPGNTPREAVHVLVRLGELQGFTIYANGPYASYGEDVVVHDSTDILLNGGYGAPPCVTFFGMDAKGRSTDSLFICNEEQGNVVLTLSISDGHLQTTQDTQPVEDNTVALSNAADDGGDDAETPIRALVLMALASVMLLLAWYYFTQRKRQAI